MATIPSVIRILHLEDNPRDAELIEHRLTNEGMPCAITVVNTKERFELALTSQSFDLVLCDFNLPGYDGPSALRRAMELCPETPVIIISGSVGEDQAVKCLHAGATDYLLKQHLERLASAARRAIQEAENRRHRADVEDALQQRERRLSSIYETVADTLFYVEVEADRSYRYASVNPAFLATTGLTYEQVVGKRIQDVLPASALATALERYEQAIAERRTVRWEETVEYPKGQVIGEVTVAPVFDAHGRCTHLVGSVHDVTERRALEAQLRQAQKMDSIGQLAGGIAHDFNNILTVINGVSDLALMHTGIAGQLEHDLREIRQAGERAAALTRQLLAFSRKQLLKPQVFDVNATVAEMGSMLRRLIGERVDLVIVAAETLAPVRADPGQIEQVIVNLAVNARDAMPDGGTLTIAARCIDIDEEFGRTQGFEVSAGRYVSLSLRDTGTGMDEGTRRRLFEPFFTTKGPGRGTGLGLSTVYGIVKQSGGFVLVETAVGTGSCFSVILPHVNEMAGVAVERSRETPVRGDETVLVVEDMDSLRRLTRRMLEASGFRVLTAASGEDALSVLEQHQHRVHLLLTDMVMPGMSGSELAERVRLSNPTIRILYMTGYTDDMLSRRGLSDPGTRHVSKPFGSTTLISAVREAIDS